MGVSSTTIRRRIKAGDLRVTETRRPQGIVWLVHLPPGIHSAADVDTADTASVDTAPSTEPTGPASTIAQAEAISGLVQTTVAAVLGPLVAELAASRQTVERQADQLTTMAEELGRARAERDAAQTSILAAQTVTPPLEPAVPVWRRWWLVAFGLAGFMVIVMLLAWPR